MPNTISWGEPEALPDGHRIFRGHFDRFAIADDSGRTPDQTDDGILWLDRGRPLKVETNLFEGKEYMFIPLISDDNVPEHQATMTITNAQTLLYLSARFDWPIVNEGNRSYRVKLG